MESSRLLLSSLFALGFAGPAVALEVFPLADDPGLATLVTEALAQSPELRRAQLSADAARERVPQAAALPDPTLTLGYEYGGRSFEPGADADTGPLVAISQPLPGSGKRSAHEAVALKDAEVAAHGTERARLTLVYDLRKAYAELLLARENLGLLEEQERRVRDIEELTRTRYAVSLAEQADVLRAQAELARLAQLRAHETGLAVAAEAKLNGLAARPAGTPVATTVRLRDLPLERVSVPPLEEVVRLSATLSPDVAAGLIQIERAEAGVAAAQKDGKADFLAAASYLNRGSMPGRFTFDLGIVLPLHKSQRQERRVAEAEVALAGERAASEAMALKARVLAERSRADLDAALREAEASASGVLAADALAAESALAGFRAGKLPFVAVLEAQRAWDQDRFKHAELLFHVLWHSARLDAWRAEEER